MGAMLEIHYTNGRKRRIPESAFVAEGESVATVIDVGFDDLSAGLLLYYKHYEPDRPDPRALDLERDARGLPVSLMNDAFAVVVAPDELRSVEQVYYEGALELFRFDAEGGLVNMHKVNKAQKLYLADQGTMNARLRIAEVYRAMEHAYRERDGGFTDPGTLGRAVAEDMGVPAAIVDECLDFQADYALGHEDYARECGLPYVDADGELVQPGGGADGAPAGAPGAAGDAGGGGFGPEDPAGFDFS